jgi:hypothetical protein
VHSVHPSTHDLVCDVLDGLDFAPHIWGFGWGFIMSRNQQFIERRSQGDYAVRKPNSDRASVVKPTQREAIDWAQTHNRDDGPILVERVRDTDRGHPDKWRKP